jgi:purine-cytosine permease-like protein
MRNAIQEGWCAKLPSPGAAGGIRLSARHLVAGLSVLATLAGVLLLAVRQSQAGFLLFVGGLITPTAFFILHLNLTRDLESAEKAVWRKGLWSVPLATVWTYLLVSDLKRESKLALERSRIEEAGEQ